MPAATATPEKNHHKGDPNKPYDVILTVIHDNRLGITKSLVKAVRKSFATAEEALAYAEQLKEVK